MLQLVINNRKSKVSQHNQTQWTQYQASRKALRHPRTIQEACGPHATSHITEPHRPMDWQDKVVVIACAVAAVASFAIMTLWG